MGRVSILKKGIFNAAFKGTNVCRKCLFYQHFDDGHLFDISFCICFTIGCKLLLFFGKRICFLFGNLNRAGC